MHIERIEPTEPEFVLRVTRHELVEIRIALAANHHPLWEQINDALGMA